MPPRKRFLLIISHPDGKINRFMGKFAISSLDKSRRFPYTVRVAKARKGADGVDVKEVPIFIASSIVEFKDERTELLAYLGTLNKLYKPRGVRLEWDNPEDMSHEMRPDGSQSEIDEAIRNCEFFFVIVGRDMGQYTLGEFETAWKHYQAHGKPKIYTYFLPPHRQLPNPNVLDFCARLKELKHYYQSYGGMAEIKLEMQIEFFRNIDFGAAPPPSSKEETAQKGKDAARELVQEQREKVAKLEKKPVTPDVIAEMTDAYEEIRRLVKEYKVEPDALLDYMVFLWKQHLYDTGIEIGHWLESFYRLDKDTDEAAWARLKHRLGTCYHESQHYEQAETYYGEALEIRRRLAKANPAAYEPDLARTCNNLGNLLSDTNRMEEAEARYGEALEIRRRLAQANPAAYEPYLAGTCNNLGILFWQTNRMEEAEARYGEALEIYRRLAKANPAAYEPHLATTCYNMGLFERDRGNRDAAKRHFEEALSIEEKYPHLARNAEDDRRQIARL